MLICVHSTSVRIDSATHEELKVDLTTLGTSWLPERPAPAGRYRSTCGWR